MVFYPFHLAWPGLGWIPISQKVPLRTFSFQLILAGSIASFQNPGIILRFFFEVRLVYLSISPWMNKSYPLSPTLAPYCLARLTSGSTGRKSEWDYPTAVGGHLVTNFSSPERDRKDLTSKVHHWFSAGFYELLFFRGITIPNIPWFVIGLRLLDVHPAARSPTLRPSISWTASDGHDFPNVEVMTWRNSARCREPGQKNHPKTP